VAPISRSEAIYAVECERLYRSKNNPGEHMKLSKLVTLLLVLTVISATFGFAQDAAALYKSKCAACHGPDGAGATAMGKKLGAKDFRSPEVSKLSDAELFDITKKGKDKMPAYDKKLTDDQIKDLVKYIRNLGNATK
jgi:cytochrome c553